MKQSWPYKVESHASGKLVVYPEWPQFPKFDPEKGGGPGTFSRMVLASDIEEFLNGKRK